MAATGSQAEGSAQARAPGDSVWQHQAAGYHRFFSQFTIPVTGPLLDVARVAAGTRVLDVAAGPGYAASAARARGARAVAADLSPAMLAHARQQDPQLPLLLTDAGALAATDGAFNAVVANFYVSHMPDPAAGVAELVRVLAPGGWVAVSSWDNPAQTRHTGLLADAVTEITGAQPYPVAPPGKPGRLPELLRTAGLDHIAETTVRWVHPIASADALWDGLLASPVRAATAVASAGPATQTLIRERFDTLAAALTDAAGTVHLPVSAIITGGQRPPPAPSIPPGTVRPAGTP